MNNPKSKLMRVYHFLPAVWALKDIAERRLKISHLTGLNDPFEFMGVDVSDRKVRAALTKTRDKMAASNGLICFCDNWKNPLMWAHYGDRYRGICLGFDVPAAALTAIRYVSSRRSFPDILTATPEERLAFTSQLADTKFEQWRYEGEQRLYVALDERDADGQFYFNFGPDLTLREVIVGAQAAVSRAEVGTALGKLSKTVRALRSRPGFGRFEIVENRKRRMWK